MTITVTRLSHIPSLLPWCSTFHRVLQFIQTAHGLQHWACRNRNDAEVFCWRQGKQEQLTVPSLSWSTQSSRSIFKIGILFHMSRTSNIKNLQFKWLQEFIDIDFPEAGIIRGRDYRAQHIFYLPETPQTPFLNCPIDSLTHQGSQVSVKRFFLQGMWREIRLWVTIDLVPIYALILFWFPLIFYYRYQKDYKCMSYLHIWHPLHWHPMYLSPEFQLLRLTQFYLLLSPVVQVMGLMDGNVIHGLKHRSRLSPQSLLYIKWWTSGRHEPTWISLLECLFVHTPKNYCFDVQPFKHQIPLYFCKSSLWHLQHIPWNWFSIPDHVHDHSQAWVGSTCRCSDVHLDDCSVLFQNTESGFYFTRILAAYTTKM